MTLTAAQRDAIEKHIAALEGVFIHTPQHSAEIERDVLVMLTKLMLTLPAMKQNELSAESKGEAYLAALDDVPAWAIEGAIRRWYRGDAGTNSQGETFDCRWCPSPGNLRQVAMADVGRLKLRMSALRRLLDAEPLIEISDEQRAAMLKQLSTIKVLGIPLVGKDGSDGTVDVTPAERAHCGTQPRHSPA